MAKSTVNDLTERIKDLIPQVNQGSTRLGFPNVEVTQSGITHTIPIKEYTGALQHLSGSNA